MHVEDLTWIPRYSLTTGVPSMWSGTCLCCPEMPRCETIHSTSYYSLIPIRLGGGLEKFEPCALVSL